ncbi:hypothetical protein B7463_g6720, partial [Scytalidium lignicola]
MKVLYLSPVAILASFAAAAALDVRNVANNNCDTKPISICGPAFHASVLADCSRNVITPVTLFITPTPSTIFETSTVQTIVYSTDDVPFSAPPGTKPTEVAEYIVTSAPPVAMPTEVVEYIVTFTTVTSTIDDTTDTLTITLFTETVTAFTTITSFNTDYQTEYYGTAAPSSLPVAKRDIKMRDSTPTIPAYASACTNFAEYAAACSIAGAAPGTTTIYSTLPGGDTVTSTVEITTTSTQVDTITTVSTETIFTTIVDTVLTTATINTVTEYLYPTVTSSVTVVQDTAIPTAVPIPNSYISMVPSSGNGPTIYVQILPGTEYGLFIGVSDIDSATEFTVTSSNQLVTVTDPSGLIATGWGKSVDEDIIAAMSPSAYSLNVDDGPAPMNCTIDSEGELYLPFDADGVCFAGLSNQILRTPVGHTGTPPEAPQLARAWLIVSVEQATATVIIAGEIHPYHIRTCKPSVIGIATFAFHESKRVYELIDTIQGASHEITAISRDLKAINAVMHTLIETISGEDSPSLVELSRVVKVPLSNCIAMFEELSAALPSEFTGTRSPHLIKKIRGKVSWALKKEKIKALQNMLLTYKCSLDIAIGAAQIVHLKHDKLQLQGVAEGIERIEAMVVVSQQTISRQEVKTQVAEKTEELGKRMIELNNLQLDSQQPLDAEDSQKRNPDAIEALGRVIVYAESVIASSISSSPPSPNILPSDEVAPTLPLEGSSIGTLKPLLPSEISLKFTKYLKYPRDVQEIDRRLLQLIRRGPKFEYKSGSIYMLRSPAILKYIKLGVTTKHPEERLWQHSKLHKFELNLVSMPEGRDIKLFRFVEALVFTELSNTRMKMACHCGSEHFEWFKITARDVRMVVKRWRWWLEECDPYQSSGGLQTFWMKATLISPPPTDNLPWNFKDYNDRWMAWLTHENTKRLSECKPEAVDA